MRMVSVIYSLTASKTSCILAQEDGRNDVIRKIFTRLIVSRQKIHIVQLFRGVCWMCGNGLFLLSTLSIYPKKLGILAGMGGVASTLTITFFDITAFHNVQHCRCRRQFPLSHSLWWFFTPTHTHFVRVQTYDGASGRMSLQALPFRGFDRRILATTDVANNVYNASFSRAHTINTWTSYNMTMWLHTHTFTSGFNVTPVHPMFVVFKLMCVTLLCERAEKFVSDDFDNRT